MMKYIKVMTLFLVSTLLISIVAIYTLPRLVNTEVLKARITTAIETHTERKLTIPADIKFSFYPKTELEINNLELSNLPGFDEQPFIHIKKMVLRVKLLPLLQNQFSIQHVILDQLKLNLRKNSQGENNWHSIIIALQKSDLIQNSTGKIEINQSTIQWKNDFANTSYTIDSLFFNTDKLTIDHASKVKSSFSLLTHQGQFYKNISLTSYIKADSSLENYNFNHSHITIQPENNEQSAEKHPITFIAESGVLDFSKEILSIPSWNLQLAGAEIQGDTHGFSLLNAPTFTGTIKTSNFNPREFFEKLNLNLYTSQHPSAFTNLSIKSQYKATSDSFIADDFQMRFDKSILEGFIQIKGFSHPAIDFSLNLNKFKISHYLSEKNYPVADWPLKNLRKLDMRGVLKIESLDIFNLTSGDNRIVVLAENGLLQVTRIESIIHGGKLEGGLTLDIKTDKPTLNGYLQLIGLNPRSTIEEWKKISLETPSIDALHRLDLSLQIDSTQELTRLSEIEIKLDKSSAEGTLSIEHSSTPKITTKLDIDHLNLDHYLHPKQIQVPIIKNTPSSTFNITHLTAFNQKCETVKIQKTDTPTKPYLITTTYNKTKNREITGDHFSELLQTFMTSQCLKNVPDV